MATTGLSSSTEPDATTDVGAIWKAAIVRYEEITKVKIESATGAKNVDEILNELQGREDAFKGYRHDNSKLDKFRTLVKNALDPIEKLSNIIAQAASSAFPPSLAIFTAVGVLIKATKAVSSDYDKITGLFEDLDLYLSRLKILEKSVQPVPELKKALTEVLTSILVLCAISTKYIKMKRIVKAFRNLVSGEDDELSTAYAHFHKMVEQEDGAVRNAILASVVQLHSKSDTIYTTVQKSQSLAEGIALDTKAILASTHNRETELHRAEIVGSLSSLDFDHRQRDVIARHSQGTGRWFLESDTFQQWFKCDRSSILWCPGIPGAGKTVMTALVVSYAYKVLRAAKAATACIYCDYKDPKTWSELGILSSIAQQLTKQTDSIPLAVKDFCDQSAKVGITGHDWIALIKSISLLFEKTYIFIDAIDECPEVNRDSLLYFLQGLESFIKIFITSRPHVNVAASFTNVYQVEISAHPSDLKNYLESEIIKNRRLSLFTARDPRLKLDIVQTLSEKSVGMFLLAYLQMKSLREQKNVKAVRETMNALPAGIFEFYGKAMERIEMEQESDLQLAKRALSYIFCAKRPLNVKELLHALAVEVNDAGFDDTALSEADILLLISAGLIRMDKESEIVGLVHFTLQEYLEANRGKLLQDPEIEFARSCLTYLSFDDFGQGPCGTAEKLHQRLEKYQFLDYASNNWGSHLSGDQLHETVVDLVFSFLNNKKKLSSAVQIINAVVRQKNNWHERFPKQFGPQHVAALFGLDKILNVLLKEGIEIDHQDSYGTTALQLASKHGHNLVVQLLLSNGANVQIKNGKGETALYWAARNGHKSIVELLLMNTAKVLTKDNEGWTALDWAVVQGSSEMLQLLLKNGTDINVEGDGRNKALYLAAEEGHELTVQMLLDNGADVNAQDPLGSTALDFAVTPGHEITVQLLLQNGADVKSRDIYKNTVLHWAVPYNRLVRLLLEHGADVNAENSTGQTALCWAAQDGPLEVAKLLLENNARVDIQDVNGFTALHRASLREREMMVQLLLNNGANPNIEDKDGWTPLHVAALKQHNGIVQMLLDRVDDGNAILESMALQLQDINKQALLEESAERKAEASTALTGLRETIQEKQLGRSQALLDKGADVNGRDIAGWTALIIAATIGGVEAVQLLLDNGADISIKGYDQRTALHWACEYGDETVVRLLVENGAEVNTSAYSWTALLLAAKDGYMTIVEFLIQNGADVNAEDYHGRTALHWAAKHGSKPVVELLLKKGADVDAIDRWERTAMIWAVENSHKVVVETLLEAGADVDVELRYTFTALRIAAVMEWELVVQKLQEKGANANAEAQCCETEETDEYKDAAAEMAEKPMSDVLRPWLSDEGAVKDLLRASQKKKKTKQRFSKPRVVGFRKLRG